MNVEFVEGKCCGDCAKCELIQRPRSQQGMQACAVANILPIVYCTHDLVVEQNALIAKLGNLVKNQSKEIQSLEEILSSITSQPVSPVIENTEDEEKPEELKEEQTPEVFSSEEQPASEEAKPKAKRLTK